MLWWVLASCVVAVEQTMTITDPVDEIVVDVTGGDVRVQGQPGDVTLSASFGGPGGGPIGTELDDGTLIVDYRCDLCGGRLTITAPPEVALDVTVGAGDLGVDGMIGVIAADLSAGSATVRDAGAGPVALTLDVGDLDASFASPPASLSADLGGGSIDVAVPGFVPYAVDLTAKAGKVEVDGILEDPSAPNLITLRADAGDISLVGQ